MIGEDWPESCCAPVGIGCRRVESIVAIDERGQMVLPKEIEKEQRYSRGISWLC
jgi:hypothetical protein